MIFGHYIRNFVRFHACFSAFWNLTAKANKTEPIRPLLPAIGSEGACAPCAPIWFLDPPMCKRLITSKIKLAIKLAIKLKT